MKLEPDTFPHSPLLAFDTLWLQVAGTLCNLKCAHCFISCSPTNHAHEMMSLGEVTSILREAEALGVKEYYVTGGEPFLNREILAILDATLQQGPATVLTNGVLIHREMAAALKRLSERSSYSLDVRVSLEGWDAATNDRVRGEGTFARIVDGIHNLNSEGLNPVVTVSEACDGAGSSAARRALLSFLRSLGLPKPRLKVMPLLRIGAEADRSRSYGRGESLAGLTLATRDIERLQCSSCRAATARGVYVCPILLDYEEARMSPSLAGSLRPFELRYAACHTCHFEGLTCRT